MPKPNSAVAQVEVPTMPSIRDKDALIAAEAAGGYVPEEEDAGEIAEALAYDAAKVAP